MNKINTNVKNDIFRLRQSFLPDRIKNYWNKLPANVKFSRSVTTNFSISSRTMESVGTV